MRGVVYAHLHRKGQGLHVQRRDPARFPAGRHPGGHRALPAAADGRPGGRGGEAGARRPLLHHDLQPRRPEPHGPLGHEAGRPGRDPRAVQADPDHGAGHPALGDPAPTREDRRQVLAGAVGAPRRRGGARRRLADDADRAGCSPAASTRRTSGPSSATSAAGRPTCRRSPSCRS